MEKKEIYEKKVDENKDIVGKRFEDLSDDEMQKIQGSGDDVKTEGIGDITLLLTSKAPYNCRS